MTGTLLCKLLQRKTYDILAKKHTILLLFVGFIVLFVSTLRFGETLITWSKENYSVVFSPYSSNILGKSYRNILCQYVPIDVVYTWVNGSDPAFLKELRKAKGDYGLLHSTINCSACVKSHMVLVRPQLPSSVTLGDLEDIAPVFQSIVNTFVVTLKKDNGQENITVLVFPDVQMAEAAVRVHVIPTDGTNHSLSAAFLTDAWSSPHTLELEGVLLLRQLPPHYSEEDILLQLDTHPQIFIHKEKNTAVLSFSDAQQSALKPKNITFGNVLVPVSPAYLVIEVPLEHEDISASRFRDNEELRYSLRSLEKHAPWVQHVYIITNGQIPFWLNLDNPSVTIITHQELFPNSSHLPTFSSPAIECHLHRIPGLSKKFIYLNDDVLFGKDVWPEDFYTHTKGQKVYLSWPVPNCAEGCPSSWIRDGYCDKPCNNSQCQWDGGDCTQDNPLQPQEATSYFHLHTSKNYCNNECADTWLADRYCDKACNVRECGYDVADCGLEHFDEMPQILFMEEQVHYYLPEGESVGYFNLSEFLSINRTLSEGFYEEHPVVRAIAISLKYQVIGIVLHTQRNASTIHITLKGEYKQQPFEKKIFLHVLTKHLPNSGGKVEKVPLKEPANESFTFEVFQERMRFPKLWTTTQSLGDFSEFRNVNASASDLPENLTHGIQKIASMKNAGYLTMEGFLKKKTNLLATYIQNLNASSQTIPVSISESQIVSEQPPRTPRPNVHPTQHSSRVGRYSSRHSTSKLLLKRQDISLKNYFLHLAAKDAPPRGPTQRHLLDTFGDSLRHVNKLYNDAFGYESRKVPSHIAHFVDRDVMERLTNRFDSAFKVTSSHKFRSSDDMQFAFSYYYYMMSEMDTMQTEYVFDLFDADASGTWSDREIRTVLVRLYDLPLDFSSVSGFEQLLINCSLSASHTPPSHTEHYYEPKMPLVTRALVVGCVGLSELLLQHFGSHKRNAFEVVGEEEVAFKMIHNNLTQVLTQIDDLRKTPRKFVCLNDNMNHGTPEAEVIRAVVQDFYESLFPMRSQFELPPEYRNRFLQVEDLSEWRRTRNVIRVVTYLTLALLILFSVFSFWRAEMRLGNRYSRLKIIESRNFQHI